MSTILLVLGTVLYFLVCGVGIILLVVGLPGLWLIVAAAIVFTLATGGTLPWVAVGVFVVMALVAEVFEAVMGVWGTKKYGGGRWAMLGALVGGIAGAILLSPLFPVIGSLVGAFAGAFGGAFALEYMTDRDFRRARRAGTGAFYGKLAAVVIKGGFAVAMIISSFVIIVFR